MEEDLCSVLALVSEFRISVITTSMKRQFYVFFCFVLIGYIFLLFSSKKVKS